MRKPAIASLKKVLEFPVSTQDRFSEFEIFLMMRREMRLVKYFDRIKVEPLGSNPDVEALARLEDLSDNVQESLQSCRRFYG